MSNTKDVGKVPGERKIGEMLTLLKRVNELYSLSFLKSGIDSLEC